jgi:undecaprenyl pyrophosphate synthase
VGVWRRVQAEIKMSTTEKHLKRIQEKLQQLLKQYAVIMKENGRLREELGSAMQKITDHQKGADELKQQVSILKVSAGEMSEADKKEFEKRINGYLKEIDRCIALLGE